MYVIIEDGIVKTTQVDPSIFKRVAEAPDDIVCGDRYENGEWVYCGERPKPLTSKEHREREYETDPLIEWERENITVDEANVIFLRYFAEGNPKADEIQTLIIVAKESIRQLYPDEEV